MLKIHASYGKKIPVPDVKYSSQQFHATVELELSEALDSAQLRAKVDGAFAAVKRTVEEQVTKSLNGSTSPAASGAKESTGARDTRKATNGQIKYMTDLARMQDLSVADLNKQVRERYGADGIYALSKGDASKLIDSMKDVPRQAA